MDGWMDVFEKTKNTFFRNGVKVSQIFIKNM